MTDPDHGRPHLRLNEEVNLRIWRRSNRKVYGNDPDVDQGISRGEAADNLSEWGNAHAHISTALERLDTYFATPVSEDITRAALGESAVIAYVRAFNKGAGTRPLTGFVEQMSPPARTAHHTLMLLRDKFLAHDINALQTSWGYVWLDPTGTEVADVGTMTARYVLGDALLLDAQAIAKWLVAQVEAEMEKSAAAMLEAVRDLNPQAVKGPRVRLEPIHVEDYNLERVRRARRDGVYLMPHRFVRGE